MTGNDHWASYLDPDTPPESRSELAAELGAHEVDALERIGGLLAGEAVWGEPSAGIRESLLARAEAEKASSGASAPPAGNAPSAPVEQGSDELAERRRRRRLGVLGGGLVAAVAAVAVLLFLFAARPTDDVDVTTYELAATDRTPDLEGTIDVRPLPAGVALTLRVTGLPPAEEGTYYAAWLMPKMDAMDDGEGMDDRPMVGVGSFHWREGGTPVGLWSGVDTDRFPMFTVTLQDEDAPPLASDVVMMTGRLTEG